MASMASSSAQEDQEETIELDPSLLQTKSVIKPPKKTNPTAMINKARAPIGDVNLERSLEIVRTAVEKSVAVNNQVMRAPMIIRPVTSQRPTGQATTSSAVLVTTADGKTLLAHPANQILRPVAPQGATPVRVRLPTATATKVTPIVGVSQPQRPGTVHQVCLVQSPAQPQQKQPVFRMPTTTSTMVIDSSQINTLIVSYYLYFSHFVLTRFFIIE